MKRRDFLRAAGIGAASLVAAPVLGARSRTAIDGNRLRIPRDWAGEALVAAVTQNEVWPGTSTELWTLGGSWPGPTIRIRRGATLDVEIINRLAEATTVHWHGLRVASQFDGHPVDAIAPGASFRATFPIANRAGTYWYHPHPHERTAPQSYRGMAGLFIVEDDEEQELDLPRGAYDLPLVIQDRFLEGRRSFDYAPTSAQRLNGMLGDTAFVNGTPEAYHEVDAGRYRLRILNGSNARILRLGFTDGRRFEVIATDGGLLDRPYEVAETLLAPAERVEIIVDFSDVAEGEQVLLASLQFGTASTPEQQGWPLDILRLVGSGRAGHSGATPPTLASVDRLDRDAVVSEQNFVLQTSPIPIGGHHHKINGVVFEMDRIDARIPLGELQLWELRNDHTMPHPMHLHGTQFQVLDRDGAALVDPRDMGWKDTVQLQGKEVVRLLVRFDEYQGTFLLHCHNLEHEDDGMMINVAVEGPGAVGEEEEQPTELDLR